MKFDTCYGVSCYSANLSIILGFDSYKELNTLPKPFDNQGLSPLKFGVLTKTLTKIRDLLEFIAFMNVLRNKSLSLSMTTKEKVTAVIESHLTTLRPIYVLLREHDLQREHFYQCLKQDAHLANRYREVQAQVSFIRKRIQIDKLERRLESIAHGRARGVVTETIRDGEGNIVQVKTIETIKAPSESALRFLLERYGTDAPRKDESNLYTNDVTDDEDYDGEDERYQTIYNVVTRPNRNT